MRHELILGGQRSGKSRCAESRALDWLAQPGHSALLIATALAGDAEMAERIARHRADRARVAPALEVLEVPHALPEAIRDAAAPGRLIVVDCLTLWLTNLLMPAGAAAVDAAVPQAALPAGAAAVDTLVPQPAVPAGAAAVDDAVLQAAQAALLRAIAAAPGPVVLVSNEIGLGVTPLGAPARRFVDALGRLHQAVAQAVPVVTLMVAGLALPVKGAP